MKSKLITNTKERFAKNAIDEMKMDYALAVIKNELVKLAVLLALFSILGLLPQLLFSLLLLYPLRMNSGGLHMKTNASCFCFSLTYFCLSLIVLPALTMSLKLLQGLLVCSLLIFLATGPVVSSKRTITAKRKRRCRIRLALISAAEVVLLLVLHRSPLFSCGAWTIILQAAQMLPACMLQKRKEVQIQ